MKSAPTARSSASTTENEKWRMESAWILTPAAHRVRIK